MHETKQWELWSNGGIAETATVGVIHMSVLICLALVALNYGTRPVE